MLLAGGALLAGGVLLYVVEPIFSRRAAALYDGLDRHDEGAAQRRSSLIQLRELEFDREMGKVDEGEYGALRAELSRNALRYLEDGSRDEEGRTLLSLEEEILEMRRALRRGLACETCGRAREATARFCGRCGAALRREPGDD